MSLSARILALLVVAAGLFISGYFLGKADEREEQLAKKSVALEQVIETHNDIAAVGQAVERATVQRAAKTTAVFTGISLGVIDYAKDHPAAADCRLDADGLRLWTAANANASTDAAAERDGALPGASGAAERRDDGPADQSHPGGQGVSRVPGSAPGADRLAGENR